MLWDNAKIGILGGTASKLRCSREGLEPMEIVAARGTYERMGYELGIKLAEAIRHNISLLNQGIVAKGVAKEAVYRLISSYTTLLSNTSLQLMEGISRGSGVPFESILRFNALQDAFFQEECTTFAAIGKATVDGKAFLLKNRDTSGNREFNGPGYYKNMTVNTTMILEPNDGNLMIGVTNAGSTGFMMGLNKYGVAVASNMGHTKSLRNKAPKEKHGISGRPQMLRESLECSTAHDAVNLILAKLTKSSMKVPGILWFVDTDNIYVVEGAQGEFAVQHVTDGAVSRSNHFELLDQLNDEKALSPICRKIRANELVEKNYGHIDREKLIEFSTDHKNGPGENSICRHSKDPEESVTVSAAIMEIDSTDPRKSRINIALGTPCQAWGEKGGSITIQMNEDVESIPQRFLDGTVFEEYFKAHQLP